MSLAAAFFAPPSKSIRYTQPFQIAGVSSFVSNYSMHYARQRNNKYLILTTRQT
jgi:hypothetical protein